MVSTQVQQADSGLDEILTPADADFAASGLKAASVLRLSRLAVLDGNSLVGCIGSIDAKRLESIRQRLAAWIAG
jgi:mRNA interferase MazF